ncbi:hypothetical protein RRG08_042203 [Elysia crispata]|uniref:DDE Tnp4 domain-containing protein n=1 Tax=Elysia crispata TaxID=231223 RepID=A0AAE1BDR7_9GAST|nr:hypothetical protein RRG08_042203 [Elysia crispata]
MWRILLRPMDVQPESATDIVKAITILHNFIMIREPERYTVSENINEDKTQTVTSSPDIKTFSNRATKNALRIRESFMDYFNSDIGALPFQRKMCFTSE